MAAVVVLPPATTVIAHAEPTGTGTERETATETETETGTGTGTDGGVIEERP